MDWKNEKLIRNIVYVSGITLISIGVILYGQLLTWMKAISITLIIWMLYGIIKKNKRSIFSCAMFFILCNLIIMGRYNGQWFWETSNTINPKTKVYGSQLTYKYGDWADVILPVFVEGKTVYIDEDNVYRPFFQCYAMDVKTIHYNKASLEELGDYVHLGPVYFQGYSYLFSEDELAILDEILKEHPQLYVEKAELTSETEVVCMTDGSRNIYIMSKEEYGRITGL